MAASLEKQLFQPGRVYKFALLDGKSITGKLVDYDKYTLLIDVAGEAGAQRILIHKHALRWVVIGVVTNEELSKEAS
jgi:sRNA-binding regulator protein Hfq